MCSLAAREMGARIRRGVSARRVIHEDGRIRGVKTGAGVMTSDWVVDAAGARGVLLAADAESHTYS